MTTTKVGNGKLRSQLRSLREDLRARDDRIAELEMKLEEIASVVSDAGEEDEVSEEEEDDVNAEAD